MPARPTKRKPAIEHHADRPCGHHEQGNGDSPRGPAHMQPHRPRIERRQVVKKPGCLHFYERMTTEVCGKHRSRSSWALFVNVERYIFDTRRNELDPAILVDANKEKKICR